MKLFKHLGTHPWGITMYSYYRYLNPQFYGSGVKLHLAYVDKITWVTEEFILG